MSKVWEVVLAAITAWPGRGTGGEPPHAKPPEKRSPEKALSPRLSGSVPGQREWVRPGETWLGLLKKWLVVLGRHKMVLLMVGGALGTYARYWLSKWFNGQPWAQGFPYGTFVINVSGSFILGVAAIVILEWLPPGQEDWYLLIGTGFCGGYTTFSTFEWETFKLIRDGSWGLALANVLGSALAGLVAVFLAVSLSQTMFTRR